MIHSRVRPLTFLCLLAALPVATAAHEPRSGQPLNLALAGAPAADVFASFASILEAELELDPEVTGEVTIELRDVSPHTAMEAVCEMLGCAFALEEGPPRRLVVKADAASPAAERPAPGSLETEVDLSLRDAPAREVFESFASIGGWKLDLDQPTITIELEDTPVRAALDQVCIQIGCAWTLDEIGDEGVLRIEWLE